MEGRTHDFHVFKPSVPSHFCWSPESEGLARRPATPRGTMRVWVWLWWTHDKTSVCDELGWSLGWKNTLQQCRTIGFCVFENILNSIHVWVTIWEHRPSYHAHLRILVHTVAAREASGPCMFACCLFVCLRHWSHLACLVISFFFYLFYLIWGWWPKAARTLQLKSWYSSSSICQFLVLNCKSIHPFQLEECCMKLGKNHGFG